MGNILPVRNNVPKQTGRKEESLRKDVPEVNNTRD